MLAVAVRIIAGFHATICLLPGWGQGGSRGTPSHHKLETLGNYKSIISFLVHSSFFFFSFDEVMGSKTEFFSYWD